MRVFLTEPPAEAKTWEYSISSRENLGLGYLAAFLRADGHDVMEMNSQALELHLDEMIQGAKDFAPELIGISLPFTDELEGALISARRICEELAPIPIIAGGHAASADAAAVLAALPALTAVVKGEGELTFRDIAQCIARGGDLARVRGLTLRGNNRNTQTAQRELIENLDTLPFPARDTLRSKRVQGVTKEIYITSSRGCPYRCSFCDIKNLYRNGKGLSWRGRSPSNIVSELKLLLAEFGSEPVYSFVDDQFIGPGRLGQERARAVAAEIKRAGLQLSFEITCRADSTNRETLLALKAAGLGGVYLGLESGSQAALDRFQKDTTVERNLEAVKLLRELDIPMDFGFIMFDHWTTADDIRANFAFLRTIAEMGVPIHRTALTNFLKLYPNTPIAEKAAKVSPGSSLSSFPLMMKSFHDDLCSSVTRMTAEESGTEEITCAMLDSLSILLNSKFDA